MELLHSLASSMLQLPYSFLVWVLPIEQLRATWLCIDGGDEVGVGYEVNCSSGYSWSFGYLWSEYCHYYQ